MSNNAPAAPSPLRTESSAVTPIDSSPVSTSTRANSPSPYESQEPALDSAGINASKNATVEVRELKQETVVGKYVQIVLLGIFLALTVFRSDDNRLKCATTTREQPPDEKEDKSATTADSIHHAETRPEELCVTLQQVGLCSDDRPASLSPKRGSPNQNNDNENEKKLSDSPYDSLLMGEGDDGTDPMFR
jgi:hypothetical protein